MMRALPPMFDLDGRVALVAGATRGIGLHIARQYVAHGGRVTIASRDADECRTVAARLNATHGDEVAWSQGFDLTDPSSIDRLVDAATAHWGRLDTLFGNSYLAVAGSAANTHDEVFANVLRANIVHGSRLAHRALPALRASDNACVIFTGSASGVAPSPSMAAYGIAKRGLMHLMQNLALEWGPLGVRVNAVAPGMTRTPAVTSTMSEEDIARRVASLPIPRLGQADEIAAACIFLAAPAGGFTTGHILLCDGGRTLMSGNTGGALNFP